MRVLLRNTKTGLYYASCNRWTADTSAALDLVDLEHAARLALEGDVPDTEIILSYSQPICQLALPVQPDWYGDWAGRAAA